jgi:uncharacterized SAM-binding protein YcdF (DUF218 family)
MNLIDQDLDTLGQFLARRDVAELTRPVDLLVLMGSAVLESVEVTAQAYRDGVTERILISGGIGHSTRYLLEAVRATEEVRSVGAAEALGASEQVGAREEVRSVGAAEALGASEQVGAREEVGSVGAAEAVAVTGASGAIAAEGRPESHIFRDLLVRDGVDPGAIQVEDRSTNCGENAEFCRRLVRDERSLLLIQDPTMQRRTHACFERAFRDLPGVELISFAPEVPRAAWPRERFVSLVLGEIRRLRDDADGYGPRGLNFIDHVDVPPDVNLAYRNVAAAYPELVRPPGG